MNLNQYQIYINHSFSIRPFRKRFTGISAIGTKDLGIMRKCLNDPEIDHNAYHNPLTSACILGEIDFAKLLLSEYFVDPSASGNSAIIAASMSGHVEIIKLLLQDKRTDPSDQNNEAIKLAASNGFTECVLLLLSDPRVDPSVLDKPVGA